MHILIILGQADSWTLGIQFSRRTSTKYWLLADLSHPALNTGGKDTKQNSTSRSRLWSRPKFQPANLIPITTCLTLPCEMTAYWDGLTNWRFDCLIEAWPAWVGWNGLKNSPRFVYPGNVSLLPLPKSKTGTAMFGSKSSAWKGEGISRLKNQRFGSW